MRLALDYLFCKNKSYELVADKDLNDFLEKYLPFFNYGKPKDEWEFCLNDWLFVTIALADLRVMNSLPEEELVNLTNDWLVSFREDMIYTLVDLGHDKIVADVYDLKGIRWFYPNSKMMGGYNYALLAFKCKKK